MLYFDMGINQIDVGGPLIERKPSGIAVVRDDFHSLNPDYWSTEKIEPGRLTFGMFEGIDAAKIDLIKGDHQQTSAAGTVTERGELMEQKDIRLPLGTEAWYAFSVYFPTDFPIVDNRTVFAQWKQAEEDSSPFLSLRYQGGKIFCRIIGDEINEKFQLKQEREIRGGWHRIIMNYQLNPDLTGKVHCQFDEEEFANYVGKMGHQSLGPSTYFKMGLYRDQIDVPQTIYLAQYRRGSTPADCQV